MRHERNTEGTPRSDGTAQAAPAAQNVRVPVGRRHRGHALTPRPEARAGDVAVCGRIGQRVEANPVEGTRRPADDYQALELLPLEQDLLRVFYPDAAQQRAVQHRLVRTVAAEHVAEGFRCDDEYAQSCQARATFFQVIVRALRCSGLRLYVQDGVLWAGPAERLTPALRAQIEAAKEPLLAALEGEESHE